MKKPLCLTLVLILSAGVGSVLARDLNQDAALRLRREGVILGLEQLIRPALARYPAATLLEAELEDEDGVLLYEVELLTVEGVVRELELDARDGRILQDKEDD